MSRPRSAAERGGADRRRRERVRRARGDQPAHDGTPRTGRASGRASTAEDRDLAPKDRGPVRAFVRDEVDARRRLVGLFLPALGAVVIAALSPASDLRRYLLLGSLAALAVALTDALLMGITVARAARAGFPGEPVPLLATGRYAFARAHRARHVRRPAPRVTPGDAAGSRMR